MSPLSSEYTSILLHISLLDEPYPRFGKLIAGPTPSNDGTCDVNIEYEVENENVSFY